MVYKYLIEFDPYADREEEKFLESLRKFVEKYGLNVSLSKVSSVSDDKTLGLRNW